MQVTPYKNVVFNHKSMPLLQQKFSYKLLLGHGWVTTSHMNHECKYLSMLKSQLISVSNMGPMGIAVETDNRPLIQFSVYQGI